MGIALDIVKQVAMVTKLLLALVLVAASVSAQNAGDLASIDDFREMAVNVTAKRIPRGVKKILKRITAIPLVPTDCCSKKNDYECGEIWEQLPCRYQQTSAGFGLCCPVVKIKQVKECSCKQCIVPQPESALIPWQKEVLQERRLPDQPEGAEDRPVVLHPHPAPAHDVLPVVLPGNLALRLWLSQCSLSVPR